MGRQIHQPCTQVLLWDATPRLLVIVIAPGVVVGKRILQQFLRKALCFLLLNYPSDPRELGTRKPHARLQSLSNPLPNIQEEKTRRDCVPSFVPNLEHLRNRLDPMTAADSVCSNLYDGGPLFCRSHRRGLVDEERKSRGA